MLAAGFFGWSSVARYSLANAHPPPGASQAQTDISST
jgi:hypothetical protein